jgi:hypothetical protein
MATEIHQFSAKIPAGTPSSAPVTINLGQANYEIESVDVEVPPGPSGLMEFCIALSGQQWIPFEMGEFIRWDNRAGSWQTENQTVNGGWEVIGFNTGEYDHTVTVRFHTNPIPDPASTDPSQIFPTVIINASPAPWVPVLL